jgi:hypothetical protein
LPGWRTGSALTSGTSARRGAASWSASKAQPCSVGGLTTDFFSTLWLSPHLAKIFE